MLRHLYWYLYFAVHEKFYFWCTTTVIDGATSRSGTPKGSKLLGGLLVGTLFSFTFNGEDVLTFIVYVSHTIGKLGVPSFHFQLMESPYFPYIIFSLSIR